MKIKQDQKPVFKPVTIILESQEEVDELFAILNNIYISEYLSTIGGYSSQLEKFASVDGYKTIQTALSNLLKD